MQPESFIHEFQNIFPEADCQTVISALRQDPMVWESLQKEEFLQTAMKNAGAIVHAWSPANLALAWLKIDETVENLRAYPLIPLEPELRQQVAAVYEDTIRSGRGPATLGDSGMIALALRERRRLTDSWTGLQAELQIDPKISSSARFKIWQTPVACLFGLAADPIELLQELAPGALSHSDPGEANLALHAVLSNPLSLTEQVNFLIRLIGGYSSEEQLIWLQQLDSIGRHDLVAQVAGNILQKEETSAKTLPSEFAAGQTGPYLSGLPQYRLGNFYQYAGNAGMSIPFLIETQQALRRLQAHVARQIADASEDNEDFELAIKSRREVVDLECGSSKAAAEFSNTLISAKKYEEAASVLPEDSSDPLVWMVKARLAAVNDDVARSQEFSRAVIGSMNKHSKASEHNGGTALNVNREFARTLLDTGMVDDAIHVAEKKLQDRPTDPELVHISALSNKLAGYTCKAISAASLAVALQPENMTYRRTLAASYEQAEDWDQALRTRKEITLRSEEVSEQDYINLARCAVQAGQPAEAQKAAQTALGNNPENSAAYAYLAEAEWMAGNPEAAVEHYTQATLIAPEQSLPWLGLSRLYKNLGDENKALSTLREAVLAAPDAADIQSALGENLLVSNTPSEALPHLRRAASLDPKSVPYALRLEGVLEDLGHASEAKEVVERTRRFWPKHPELAFAHGKVLLALGETPSAIDPLRVKLHSQPKDIDPYLLFAKALANLPGDKGPGIADRFGGKDLDPSGPLTDARDALEKALEIDPNSLEARVLLAENLSVSGILDEAYNLFLSLSETIPADDPAWNGRVKLGLGKTTLGLGQTDAALAALQEAATAMPDNLSAQQSLAEAYLAAGLDQEAYQAAQSALRLYPANCQNLVWYAGMTYTLGVYPESIATLERAAELSANPTSVYLKMAQVYLRAENATSARSVLDGISTSGQASPEELRQASHAWLVLGEPEKATECLSKAIEIGDVANNALRNELAQVLDFNEQSNEALQKLHESLEIQPDQRKVYVFQANLLAKTGHFSEALSSLGMALRMPDEPIHAEAHPATPAKRIQIPEIHAPKFKTVNCDTPHVHLLMTSILRKTGRMAEALEHATRAVELSPEDPDTAALAGDLAFGLLDLNLAQTVSEKAVSQICAQVASDKYSQNTASETDEDHVNTSISLLCTNAELAIENDQIEQAKALASTAYALCPSHPRVMAVQARIAAADGDFSMGEHLYETAINRLSQTSSYAHRPTAEAVKPALFSDELVCGYPTLTLAQTALDLQHWDEAVQLLHQAVKNVPDEARTHLFLARALVLQEESQRVLKSLKVVNHLPGEDRVGQPSFQLFEKAIQMAGKLSSAPLVTRWRTRGYAAYNPDLRSADLLNQLPPSAEDAAAQASVIIQCGEPAKAVEYVKPYTHHPKALMQMALACQKENPAEGFFAARSLVGAQKMNPMHQAALALLAGQVEEYDIARDAIDNALAIWPDEPGWQSLAADLNLHCGDFDRAVQHQEKAADLDRTNPEYALALAKSYLRIGKTVEAIRLLDEASRLSPDSVEIWSTLAEAHAETGDLTSAIASAERAITMAPDQTQPVLLCGELALKAGQIELARQRAQHAARLDAGENQAVLLLVRAQEAQGQFDEALQTIEGSLNKVREPYGLQLEQVSLTRKLHGAEAALNLLRSLAENYEDEPAVHTLYAEALIEAGQRETAERAAQKALHLQPEQPDLHLMVGRLQRTSGQLDQAIHHLSEAIRLSPKEIDAYLELGRAYQDRREYTQALNIFKQAIELSGRDARPYYQSGLVLKESKDYTGAEKMLRRAADLAPDDVNIRRQLGAIIALNLVRNLQEAS